MRIWNTIRCRLVDWVRGLFYTADKPKGALCWHCAEAADDREQMLRLIHEEGSYECSKCGATSRTTFVRKAAAALLLIALGAQGAVLAPQTLFPSSGAAANTLTNGLLAHYRMDESSGNLADSFGTYTMTNVGTMGFSTGGGRINGAVSNSTFSASNRYFWRGGDNAAKWFPSSIASLSVACWFFSTNTVANSSDGDMWGPSQYDSSTGNNDVQFFMALRTGLPTNARRAEVAISGNGATTSRKVYRSTNSLPANQWNLVVFTFTNNVLKLYTNGVEVTGAQLNKDEDASVTSIPDVAANAATIGTIQVAEAGSAGAQNGKGAMDLASIWNRVLTDAEITSLWNGGTGRDPVSP